MNSYRRCLRNGVLVNPKLFILEKVNLAPHTIGWSNLVKLGQLSQTWSNVLKLVLFGTGRYILSHCHDSACGGHFASQKTTMKVLEAGFYWPSLFKDVYTMCKQCDKCQRLGKISHCHKKPLNPILVVELFDI